MAGVLQPLNGVIRLEAEPAGRLSGKSIQPDAAPSFMPRLQRLQMKRAAEGPRRRRHTTRPRPLTVRLLPQPAPLPPTAAKTPALARLQVGTAAAHTTPVEAILEMERAHGFAPTPLEGVPERAFVPPNTAFVPRSRRLASLRGQGADAAGSMSDAGTPALLPGRNCAPPLPSTGPTTRSRSSSRSSSGSPVDNFLQPPASASAAAAPPGRTRSSTRRHGRSRFGADSGPSDAAAAAASEAIVRSSSGGASGDDDDTFSFGMQQRETASSLSPGGSSSHDDAAEGGMGPAESPDEPVLRTRWDTVSKAGTLHSAMRPAGSPADWGRRSSIGASVQQLRFGAPTPAPRRRLQASSDAVAPADADRRAAGDAAADAAADANAAPQPVSPVERAMAEAAQQQADSAAAAAAAEPAYSSDDDCGGYEGGDAGGYSDFEDEPPEEAALGAETGSQGAAADGGLGSEAADAAGMGGLRQLPAVTPVPRPRPARRTGAPKHQNERLKYCRRKSLAGLGLRTQGGVRRSSRSHHRPLEYWRNEKKVYTGRDHTSLPTMDHYEERTPSPMWPAPSKWAPKPRPAKRKSRMAKGSK